MARRNYWQRFQRTRVSRRRVLAAGGIGAAGLAVAAACGGGGGEGDETPGPGETPAGGETPSSGVPKSGGRYVTATDVPPDTLDPHISVAGGPSEFPRFYNALLVRSPLDQTFEFNDLAESFEQPDETTYVYSIRPGVKIAPNDLGIAERDMEAEDALVSFERIKGLPEANACAFVCEWFDTHEAPDPQTYIARTPSPYAFYLIRLGSFYNTIPPRELIQDNPDRMRDHAVGGGPYYVSSYVEAEHLNMDRNVNYYRTDENNNNAPLPYFDARDLKFIADRAARRAAFIGGQIYSYTAESIDEAEQLERDHDVYAIRDPVFTFISLTMNVERSPWDDPRIRKAAMYAINRQDYIDIVYKGDARADGLVNWPLGVYALSDEELEELQPYDPQRSRDLIKEATGEDTLKIKVMYPGGSTIEEHDKHLPIFIKQMEDAGFELDQDVQDFATWLDNYTNKNYDLSFSLNQTYETPEFILDWQSSKGPAGSSVYCNGLEDPDLDAQLEHAKTLTDPDEIVEEYHRLQRVIYEKGPVFLPIVSPYSRTLYWDFVKDVVSGISTAANYVNTTWLDL